MNPFMDQERVNFIRARVGASKKKGLLSAWPREDRDLPVVELEVDWVRLSTLNHRTRAEQRREVMRSGQQDLFTADPLGEEAQSAQYKILCGQSGFGDLKQNLESRGQQEHAVVTAEGVLINGNRRTAALRSLYHDEDNLDCRYVRCLVLPADATPTELVLLETELQVAKDFKQDYSWVNQALLIEELYEQSGRSFDKVAALMHRSVKEVREDYEKIQQVNQLVDMSGGASLHVDFEPNESAFNELAQYIRNKTEDEKEAVRTVYFLGTLSGVNYRELRHLRRSDALQLVSDELSGDAQLDSILELAGNSSAEAHGPSDDLLDAVLGEGAGTNPVASMLNLVSRHDRETPLILPNGSQAELGEVFAQLRGAVEKAAHEAAEQKKDHDAVVAPIKRLEKAAQELARALDTLDSARATPGWDEVLFAAKLDRIRELVKSLGKTQDDPS